MYLLPFIILVCEEHFHGGALGHAAHGMRKDETVSIGENHHLVLPRQGPAAVHWFLMALAGSAPSSALTKPQATIPCVPNLAGNHAVILFVHGVTGDERSTWTSGDQYWPSMLTRDPSVQRVKISTFTITPSPRLGKTFSIDELADNMRRRSFCG